MFKKPDSVLATKYQCEVRLKLAHKLKKERLRSRLGFCFEHLVGLKSDSAAASDPTFLRGRGQFCLFRGRGQKLLVLVVLLAKGSCSNVGNKQTIKANNIFMPIFFSVVSAFTELVFAREK